jgi:hypothetical protein
MLVKPLFILALSLGSFSVQADYSPLADECAKLARAVSQVYVTFRNYQSSPNCAPDQCRFVASEAYAFYVKKAESAKDSNLRTVLDTYIRLANSNGNSTVAFSNRSDYEEIKKEAGCSVLLYSEYLHKLKEIYAVAQSGACRH